MSGLVVVDRLASVREYLQAEKADSTRRAYAADFADFALWCTAASEASLSASPMTVARYLASLADQGKKASTIVRRVAAIRYAHRMAGHEPPTNAEGVRAVVRGIRRKIGVAPNRKAPATAQAITAMLDGLPSDLVGLRDRALLILGFAAALRRSELVAIDIEDIEITAEGVRLTIRRSKTDQEGEGYVISIPRGTKLRPAQAIEEYLAKAGIESGPLLRTIVRGAPQPGRMCDRTVARIVKRRARKAGLDPKVFSGHSLRSGFVTTALERGADVLAVMDITRHKQVNSLKVYDRRARGFKNHAGRSFL